MFNETEWPELARLYRLLEIETELVNASQSYSIQGQKSWLTTNDARQPANALGLLTNPIARTIAGDLRRLMCEGRKHLLAGVMPATLGNYLKTNRYSDAFVYQFLYPTLSSTVCTCRYEALDQYPSHVILETLQNLMDDRILLRVRMGTSQVVEKLAPDKTAIRLNTTIASIKRSEYGMTVRDSRGLMHEYDQVILAIQSNQSRNVIEGLTTTEARMFDAFRYEPVQVVVHNDPRLMPIALRDWRTFNMISNPELSGTFCSVWLNKFHRDWPAETDTWFQTIWAGHPDDYPVPTDRIISRASMQRVVVTSASAMAWKSLDEIHQDLNRRLWFCGSWAAPGTPLLESGVVSANRVVSRIAKICGLANQGEFVTGPDYCSTS